MPNFTTYIPYPRKRVLIRSDPDGCNCRMKIASVQRGRNEMGSGTILRKGDTAPGFSLSASLGKTVTLDDFKGRKLLIYFFPKAGTSG
jgi:hypothetical protein